MCFFLSRGKSLEISAVPDSPPITATLMTRQALQLPHNLATRPVVVVVVMVPSQQHGSSIAVHTVSSLKCSGLTPTAPSPPTMGGRLLRGIMRGNRWSSERAIIEAATEEGSGSLGEEISEVITKVMGSGFPQATWDMHPQGTTRKGPPTATIACVRARRGSDGVGMVTPIMGTSHTPTRGGGPIREKVVGILVSTEMALDTGRTWELSGIEGGKVRREELANMCLVAAQPL